MKIDVTPCKECIYFIGSDYSNTGHCSMWNKPCIKEGYCYHAETEVPEDE